MAKGDMEAPHTHAFIHITLLQYWLLSCGVVFWES